MAKRDPKELVLELIPLLGGPGNIQDVENCMTRLRLKLVDRKLAETKKIEKVEGVMGIVEDDAQYQIVLGPGYVNKCKDAMVKALAEMPKVDKFGHEVSELSGVTLQEIKEAGEEFSDIGSLWDNTPEELKAKQKEKHASGKPQTVLKHVANIFVPLIPAIVAWGLCAALANVFLQLFPDAIAAKQGPEYLVYLGTQLFGQALTSFFIIFVGVNTAKECNIPQVMGGLIGAVGLSTQIVDIAKLLNWYDATTPLQSILSTGKGGVIGVIVAVFLMSYVYKFLEKHTPDSLSLILVPTLALIIIGVPYIFLIMPGAGFVSNWIQMGVTFITASDNIFIRAIAGFVLSALFLPLVLLGLHQALIPVYAIELEATGSVSLFIVLAMAGAGQVGAAIALYLKARKKQNHLVKQTIGSCIIPGILGVAEPLIYGVTFPLGRPFFTACIGSGFAGAAVMALGLTTTSWGPSGILLTPLLSNFGMIPLFFLCLLIGYVMGFLFTMIFCKGDIFADAGR